MPTIASDTTTQSLAAAPSSTPPAKAGTIRERRFDEIPISPEHGKCWIHSPLGWSPESHPTILLVSGGQGGGHLSPMDAVSESMLDETARIIYVDKAPVHSFKRHLLDHMRYTTSNTRLGAMIANHWRHRISAPGKSRDVVRQTRSLIDQYQVDYVFTNHRFVAYALSEGLPDPIPLAVGLADPGKVHQGWFVPRLKRNGGKGVLLATNEITAAHAAKHGVPPKRIKPFGYPLRPEFARAALANKEQIRQDLGIPEEYKRVLMMTAGNARDPGPLVDRIKPLLQHPEGKSLYVMVLAAGNAELEGQLTTLGKELKASEQIRILSKLDAGEMANHMRASDLMAIQPGGGSIGECFALGVVPILWGEKSGIEHSNRRMVHQSNTGTVAFNWNRPWSKWTSFTQAVFGDHDNAAMIQRQRPFVLPTAAQDIASFLLNEAQHLVDERLRLSRGPD